MSNTEEQTHYTKVTTYLGYDKEINSVHIGHYSNATKLIDSLHENDLKMNTIKFNFFKTEVKSYGVYSQSVQLNTIFGDARLELENNHKHFCPESVVDSEQVVEK